jgi:hypothetical protein
MKSLLPDRVELAVLSALALLCALVAGRSSQADLWLAALSVPLFITAAVMGLRRNWRLAEARQTETTKRQEPEPSSLAD